MKRVLVGLVVFSAMQFAAASEEIETIVVEGRQINLLGDAVSASEGMVGQKEIELRPLLRTGEVLELVPGMVVTQHSGTGKANQYFLRGFNLDHGTDFATSIDGMPVNMRTHGHGQGYSDLNFLIPETVAQLAYKKVRTMPMSEILAAQAVQRSQPVILWNTVQRKERLAKTPTTVSC